MSRGSTLSRMVSKSRGLNPVGPRARARIKKRMPALMKSMGLMPSKSGAKGFLSRILGGRR